MAQDQQVSGSVGTQLQSGALAGTWTLDPSRTTVALKTKAMWGLVPVKGSFAATGGTATVTPEGAVTATVEISSASINTKMKKRDEHLRSDDFFAADAHPTITVAIDHVDAKASDPSATGSLTVRGQSTPLTFPLTVTSLDSQTAELDAVVEVDRSQVGIDFKAKGATKMVSTMTVHAVFTRS
jgi:polyisoprenoid-binding protein YceI